MRVYTVTTHAITLASITEFAEIKGAAGKMIFLLRAQWVATDTSIPTAQMIDTSFKWLGATLTDGTGGATTTPGAVDPGDAAASFTCKTNNTTASTSSGTTTVLLNVGGHVFNGIDQRFAMPGSEGGGLPPALIAGPSEAISWALNSTVSGTVHGNMALTIGEIGG